MPTDTPAPLSPHANIPLLRKYVEWVEDQDALEEHLREWSQWSWAIKVEAWLDEDQYEQRIQEILEPDTCGTAYCLAGKVVADAGYKFIWQSGEAAGCYDPKDYPNEDFPPSFNDPKVSTVRDMATALLGLDSSQTYRRQDQDLFEGDNTAEDIRRIAELHAGERL